MSAVLRFRVRAPKPLLIFQESSGDTMHDCLNDF